MNGDDLDRIFGEPVEPLPGSAERFDRIVAEARRRRRARAATVALSAAAVLVVVALGAAALLTGRVGTSRTTVPPAASSSGVSTPTSSSEPSGSPSPSHTASEATTPASSSSAGAGLPAGGPVPAGLRVQSVTTASNDVSYVLGDVPGCGNQVCTSMARSTDGGQTWRGVAPPQVPIVTDPLTRARKRADAVSDVRFADPHDGWLFGGALWATHDGTASWQQVDVGGTVLDLATDGTTVWAVVADCTGPYTCRSARLLEADATGGAFTPVKGVTADGPVSGATLSVVGRAAALVVSGATETTYLRVDGGWRPVPDDPCPRGGAAVTVPATDPATVVALCPSDPGAGSVTLVPYRSDDGGRSWTATGRGLRVPNGVTRAFTAATPDELAVAVGSPDLGGGLWVSHDGGASWTDGQIADAQRSGWAWVGAAGGHRYLALPFEPGPVVWVSTDAGRTWQVQRVG